MKPWPKKVFAYTDGASRGNPGPSALGLQIFDENKNLIHEAGRCLGENTNNFAEYSAVLEALQLCHDHHIEELCLFSDSQLLIRQLTGEYKIKSANIRPLAEKCMKLLQNISKTKLVHIPREQNSGADHLANQALDASL